MSVVQLHIETMAESGMQVLKHIFDTSLSGVPDVCLSECVPVCVCWSSCLYIQIHAVWSSFSYSLNLPRLTYCTKTPLFLHVTFVRQHQPMVYSQYTATMVLML